MDGIREGFAWVDKGVSYLHIAMEWRNVFVAQLLPAYIPTDLHPLVICGVVVVFSWKSRSRAGGGGCECLVLGEWCMMEGLLLCLVLLCKRYNGMIFTIHHFPCIDTTSAAMLTVTEEK